MKSTFVFLIGTLLTSSLLAAQGDQSSSHFQVLNTVGSDRINIAEVDTRICKSKPISFDKLNLTVSDFYSRNKQNLFENLRNSAEYDSEGRNIISVIPNKSILKVIESASEDYVKVQVVSLAIHEEDNTEDHKVASIGDVAFIHMNSLRSMLDYNLKISSDLIDAPEGNFSLLKATSENQIEGIECCKGAACSEMLTFKQDVEGKAIKLSVAQDNIPFFNNVTLSEKEVINLIDEDSEDYDDSGETLSVSGVKVVNGFRSKVICTPEGGSINVYNRDQEVTGQKENGLELKLYQGEDAETFDIEDRTYTKVIVDGEDSPLWLVKDMISDKQNCESLNRPRLEKVFTCTESGGEMFLRNANEEMTEITDQAKSVSSGVEMSLIENHTPNEITATLDGVTYSFRPLKDGDSVLWAPDRFLTTQECAAASGSTSGSAVFPISKRPTADYSEGMRAFNAGRGGGRSHAANDLYTRSIYFNNKGKQRYHRSKERSEFGSDYNGGKFRAIADGKVIRQMHAFYLNTYEMAVKDDAGGKVWRYGEVYHSSEHKKDHTIRKGQELGKIKWVGLSVVPPMLHLERYRARNGVHNGALRKTGRHKRPFGLVNPTSEVKQLENRTFGRNW
jgi:hypothetical protein